MKLVILGDPHFGGGYSLGTIDPHRQINNRLIDFSNTFDYVLDYMKINNIKHFVITGDIFEHRRPYASELGLFSGKMRRLSEIGIHTYIVIGNHDTIQEQCATTIDVLKHLKLPMVHIFSDINSITCADIDNAINLIFFPFRTRRMLGCSSNVNAVGRSSERLQYEINSIHNNDVKILIGHFMLQDTPLGDKVASGHMGEVVLPLSMFDGLDGVIMGHIHHHYIVRKEPLIAYVGSMERKDFGNKGEKYFLVVESKDNNISYKFEKLPTRPLYDINIDRSLPEEDEKITEYCKDELNKFSKSNNMLGSIVRIGILIDECNLYNLDIECLKRFLKDDLKIHHCSGIHVQAIPKRQLRKSTITERIGPLESFKEYLTLIQDEEMRRLMYEKGKLIIEEESK
jgi:exonuclease SbcD